MARTDLEEMVLRMSADITKMQRTFDKAVGAGDATARKIENRFNGMNKGVSRQFAAMGNSIKAGLSGAVAGLSVKALFDAGLGAVKAIAEIGDLAEAIGLTVEQLQAYKKLGLETGTSSDNIAKGLQSIAEQAVDAESALSKLFAANGISARNAAGALRPMNDIIRDFATLVQGAATNADQLAIVTGVLGDRVGRQLVEAFRKGSDGVSLAYDNMVKSGEYHSATEVQRIQKIEEAYNRVTERIATRWQQMVVGIISGLDSVISAETAAEQGVEKIRTARENILRQGTRYFSPNRSAATLPRTSGAGSSGGPNEFAAIPFTQQSGGGTANPFGAEKPDKPAKSPRIRSSGGSDSSSRIRQQADAQVDAYRRIQGEIDSYIKGLGEERQALELEIATFGLSLDQKAKAEAIAKIPVNASAAQRAAAIAEADAIAQLTARYDAMQRKQEEMREISDAFRGSLQGLVSDIANGKKPVDALIDALDGLASKLLDLSLNSLFDGLFGGATGASGGLLSGLFGFAKGGVMTSRGPMPLHAYARGGVANSPQVALFGEGRKPEAFVPLPDGRSIPVSMKGGMASKTVLQQTINISGTGDAQIMANVRKAIEFGNRQLVAKLPKIQLEHSLRAE